VPNRDVPVHRIAGVPVPHLVSIFRLLRPDPISPWQAEGQIFRWSTTAPPTRFR
jgi:hypothetical protein